MLENLSERLNKVLRYLRGEVKVTEENMQQALKDIRLSLLEADVNFKVVKQFIENIRVQAMGREVHDSLNPTQQVIKIVQAELTAMLGSQNHELNRSPLKPTIIMLAGLQGSGKTTTAGKLALHLKGLDKSSLLCSLDLKRLAAGEQLEIIARESGINFFKSDSRALPVLARQLKKNAADTGYDYVIADTAGRLHVDEELMEELRQVKAALQPAETIFVADALTGQDAVNSARSFAEKIGVDSIILTKLDADTRGGAALSIVSVTGKPIKFIGVGEKTGDLQKFFPERLAAKILGMGDMLTLIEKAEKDFDHKQAEILSQRLLENEFSLEDFLAQLRQVEKLGPMNEVMGMLPNLGFKGAMSDVHVDEKRIRHLMAVIESMTRKERDNPKIVDGRRRLRISRGAGRPVSEVNQVLKSYFEMKKNFKKPFFRKMLKKFDNFSKMR
ncbi:MAG: signal recognition particle protein [Candidatus Aminicenantes bacterium]|nr:signal recognition particle protein [Acidobacteriota bacterium]MCG2810822.1 signal recognition particle protein [Candidatus Aminicenantes bacterium]